MTIQETLAQVRAKYGPTPTTDECGAICNETAFIHRNDPEKWGVNRKDGGNHAVRYDGMNIAADIIQNGVTGMAYDCLVAAGDGGPASPAWNAVGVITDPARPWVAPIVPEGGDDGDNGGGGDETCPCEELILDIDTGVRQLVSLVKTSNEILTDISLKVGSGGGGGVIDVLPIVNAIQNLTAVVVAQSEETRNVLRQSLPRKMRW